MHAIFRYIRRNPSLAVGITLLAVLALFVLIGSLIVDTEDALLIAHRDHSQDVGKVVKELGLSGRDELI